LQNSYPSNSGLTWFASWGDLLDELEGVSDRGARAIIARWLERMELRLASTLAHSPLR